MESFRKPDPTILVIFGASGDLTWRKLVPALYDLHLDGRLPAAFAVVAIDKKGVAITKYREHLREGAKKFSRHENADGGSWKSFAEAVSFLKLDFTVAESYAELAARIEKIEKKWDAKACKVFYLAVPPALIEPIARNLSDAGFARPAAKSRLVVEKPFGHDQGSAHRLNDLLAGCFEECSIFRIDHYLGKETVQNIIAFRFANALFEPLWNRNYIDHVQITVSEKVGVGHRGGYYEHAGALRDMVQNHLMQLLCLVAMEPPIRFGADEIRNRKIDVLRAIREIGREEVHHYAVRGQYGPGWIEGEKFIGYREEKAVDAESSTETFAALKLYVDNWRWQGVPFYLRTGKRMAETLSIIAVQFRPVPHQAFPIEAVEAWAPNLLIISIQPQKGIRLRFQAKRPGLNMILRPVDMLFNYSSAYEESPPAEYETLLLDVMLGDSTLFMRRDQIEAAWRVLDPILAVWDKTAPPDFPDYEAGRWGPEDAEGLIARDGHNWVSIGLGAPACQEEEER